MSKEFFVTAWYRAFANWRADKIRFVMGAGPEWKMYKKLAHRLVDNGEWFMIPLFSGMQTPLINAIDYLAEIKDYESIPRLKKLLGRYTPHLAKVDRSYEWQGMSITNIYGPDDYMPGIIQSNIVKALLHLLPSESVGGFVQEMFFKSSAADLGGDTITVLVNFAVQQKMDHMGEVFLNSGKGAKRRFDTEFQNFKESRIGNRGISYDQLYVYEDLIYGAYKLFKDGNPKKEEALEVLIQEYNHLDSEGQWDNRPHDGINTILCEIVDDVADKKEEQERIVSLLNPERFERDMARYKEFQKIKEYGKVHWS